MGKWVHRLAGVDPVKRTATCSNCGPVSIRPDRKRWKCMTVVRAWRKAHPSKWRKSRAAKARYRLKSRRPYRLLLGRRCARCGFVPEHRCQLDVDHVDGDHKNNTPENLQTLCANCHRLKTWNERHGISPSLPLVVTCAVAA